MFLQAFWRFYYYSLYYFLRLLFCFFVFLFFIFSLTPFCYYTQFSSILQDDISSPYIIVSLHRRLLFCMAFIFYSTHPCFPLAWWWARAEHALFTIYYIQHTHTHRHIKELCMQKTTENGRRKKYILFHGSDAVWPYMRRPSHSTYSLYGE